MNPVETWAELNRACEALARIRDVEARFEAAKSKADLAPLLSDMAEARAAIVTISEMMRKERKAPPTLRICKADAGGPQKCSLSI